MSPERAAETERNEIVALLMPTCLSSAALVPRAHLFLYSYPGLRRRAIELSPADAGSGLGSRLRLRLRRGRRLRLTRDKYLFNGLRPGEKRAKARGEEPCCARW